MKLPPFYPVFDNTDWLRRLLPLGIKLVQLRAKGLEPDALHDEIQTAKVFTDAANCQLVVNDFWELAIELECDFIHLGQEDIDDADLKAIRNAGIRIGISTHSDQELERALALQPDYIALGPVYPTILKKMPWQPQGLDKVTEWKQRIGEIPLVGIGGLNPERARAVFNAGADIVSVVTDITLNPEPETRTSQWINLVRPENND